MSDEQTYSLEPDARKLVIDALIKVGVAGNEEDRPFEAQDIQASLGDLEEQLRRAHYHGGSLSIGTLARPNGDVGVLVYDSDRYAGLDQAELAWEYDYQQRWHDIVERRVADWLRRLDDLRSRMADWVKQTPAFASLELFDLKPMQMSESLMRRFGVPPRDVPVFEFREGPRRVMHFQPKGLWVIGANGRVDLTTKSASRILVDKSEPLAPSSDWQMYDLRKGIKSFALTAETFREFVRSGLE